VTDHDEWNEQGPHEVTAPRRNAHWRPAGPPPRPHVGPAGVVREAPTLGELAEAAYQRLPPQEAARLLAGAQPMAAGPRPDPGNAPPPRYTSFAAWLTSTTDRDRRAACARRAGTANRDRLMSGPPAERITGSDVWAVLAGAGGRCAHCGSLAVERRPSGPDGGPLPWEPIGRRIGSLGHRVARLNGGPNTPDNLIWSCLLCNTWPSMRTPEATDYGAVRGVG
jgi:hypothetical protein